MRAPLPENEISRLAALRLLKILDSPAEERFDRITRLAQALFDVPMAVISLIDENRQWFKSRQGLDDSETSRDVSFCAHAILQKDTMVVEDALKDVRFSDNPFVTGKPHVRAYAGAPLSTDQGHALGTLCVIDSRVRKFTKAQLAVLRDLADIVENEINMLDLRTAMAKLEQAKRFFDVSQDLLCTTDFEGKFTFLSPNWTPTLGYEHADLIGRRFLDYVWPADQEKTKQEFANLSKGQLTFNFENRYQTKSGDYRWFLWQATAFPNEKVVFASARDITEKKKIEEMKDDFVAVVSHELRTPITSIRGTLSILAGGLAGPLPEEAKPLVQIGISSCDRLVRLVNDILEVEKLECGGMEFKMNSADLREVVKNAVTSNKGFGSQYNVKINLLPGVRSLDTIIDSDRITQVVTNLISNAVKFSPQGGTVNVTVTPKGRSARVAVSDHGPGIPEDFKPKIFGRFSQSAAGKSKKASSGLGLNISKAIVEKHGGSIGFESDAKTGTTFYFDLPTH